jgi:hypothetical protein
MLYVLVGSMLEVGNSSLAWRCRGGSSASAGGGELSPSCREASLVLLFAGERTICMQNRYNE